MSKEKLYTLRWFINEGWGDASLQPSAAKIIDELIGSNVNTPVVEASVEAPVPVEASVKAPVVEAPVPVEASVKAPVVEAPVVEAPVVEAPVKAPVSLRPARWHVKSRSHLVCIDPGHGGKDSGAINLRTGLKEKHVALSVSRKVKAILEANFVVVYLTREGDGYVSLPERAQISNSISADAFVSVHCNDADNKLAEGMETYCHNQGNHALAASIHAGLREIPGHKDRGVKQANFSVLRRTKAPAALVECEFINHATQGKWLSTEKAADELALAIARGILGFLRSK